MKRYLVFSGSAYYPGGGMSDFIGSFDDFDFALGIARGSISDNPYGWFHVYDCIIHSIVSSEGY